MLNAILRRKGLLTQRQQELRAQEQELFIRLEHALQRFGADVAQTDLQRFHQAKLQLDQIFLLIVAGEFNSGKSSFINALIGERVLPEGVTPTTDRINLLRYGDAASEDPITAELIQRTYPAEILREMNIVDTPGTNAVIRKHEELTADFIPRCDLVLFVTSADRPFTESERAFLEQIKQWGKKIIFIVNKIDILSNQNEIHEITGYVRENAVKLLGSPPEIFPVSARQALKEEQWEKSGFAEVEDYLVHRLTQEERLRLKLLNPLNVGLKLTAAYKDEAFQRLKMLTSDISAIQNIDQQLSVFHKEVLEDYEPRLASIHNTLREIESRGLDFFDENIRVKKFRNLLSTEKMRNEFERQVLGTGLRQLEEEVNRLIDWIMNRNLKLWQDLDSYIDRRQISRHKTDMIGEVGSTFHYNRQALYDSVGKMSREVIENYNRDAEARRLAQEVQDSFAATALAEAGAVGLGTVLVIIANTALADFTGILAAAAVAVGGLYIIPARRSHVKNEFRKTIQIFQKQLTEALTRQVHRAVSDAVERTNETIAPYRRFVTMQHEQLSEAREELVAVEDGLNRLKTQIERA